MTSTATKPRVPTRFAMYLEARPSINNTTDPYTHQVLIIPPMTDNSSGVSTKTTEPKIITREVSGVSRRSQWKQAYVSKFIHRRRVSARNRFPELDLSAVYNLGDAIRKENLLVDRQLTSSELADKFVSTNTYQSLMVSMLLALGNLNDKTVSKPIFIELTDADESRIYKDQTPSALMRRLDRCRIEAGLPEELVEPFSRFFKSGGSI